ncbi:MAG TPA: hypothetical protein VL426_04690 [Candidatus Binatia bacterium]|nr:hypothetical protein [Candidatus Binatia bacterium]
MLTRRGNTPAPRNLEEFPMKKLFGSLAGILLFFLVINLVFGGLATEYVVEFWGSRYKGQPVDVPFFPCVIGGLFLGELTIPAAVLTWLFSFVI